MNDYHIDIYTIYCDMQILVHLKKAVHQLYLYIHQDVMVCFCVCSFDKSCTVLISIVTGIFDLYNIEHPPIRLDVYIMLYFFSFLNCALLFDNFCVFLF